MARRSRTRNSANAVPAPLHELESEVMEAVWASQEATVRAVMEALNARTKRGRAYTTYMTIMARLHRKGLLARRRHGKTDVYSPVYAREEYMRLRAGAEVKALLARFGDAALAQFAAEMARLDPARRRSLQRLARKA